MPAKLTQAALAEKLGIHRSYLSQLESGELFEQVKRVFDVLNALEARSTMKCFETDSTSPTSSCRRSHRVRPAFLPIRERCRRGGRVPREATPDRRKPPAAPRARSLVWRRD
jgi:transcriptional regulator with XRE-family HTH domain